MRAIGKLLRLRRRSDKVKLALGLFLLGAVLGWDVAFGAAGFLMESGEPVEYVPGAGTGRPLRGSCGPSASTRGLYAPAASGNIAL